MSRRILFLSVVGALALGGCATIPKPLQGKYTPVSLSAARSGTATASSVRWGGQIVATEPQAEQTCFFVLKKPLNSQARPERNATSTGRFVACKQGFYDPEVFKKGRELTVTGTLDGTVQHKIGKFNYTYAKLNASNIYLWKKRAPRYVMPYEPWGPWYGGFGPYWGPAWGPLGFGPWGGLGPWGFGAWYYP